MKKEEQRKIHENNFLEQLKHISSNIILNGKYINNITPIECECEKHHIFYRKPCHLLRGQGCPICSHQKIIPEINSLWAERPDLRKFIAEESIEISKHIGQKSSKYIVFKCPECGATKKIRADHFTDGYFSCPVCADCISYPNKMLRVFLLKIEENGFITNLSFEKYVKINGKRSWYDYSFLYNGIKYFCEIDGGYHRKETMRTVLEDTKKRDEEKNKYAKDNNIKLIRIPLLISNFELFKEAILKSEFIELFDLSNFDWKSCEEDFIKIKHKGRDKAIIDTIVLNSGKFTFSEYSFIFNMSKESLYIIFKRGIELNWCKKEDIIKNNAIKKPFIAINLKTKQEFYFRNIRSFLMQMGELKNISNHDLNKKIQEINKCIKEDKIYNNFQFKIISKQEYLNNCLILVILSENYKEIKNFYESKEIING